MGITSQEPVGKDSQLWEMTRQRLSMVFILVAKGSSVEVGKGRKG